LDIHGVNGPVGLIPAETIIKEQELVQLPDAITKTMTRVPIEHRIGGIQVTDIIVQEAV
jgi:hypothetical protein